MASSCAVKFGSCPFRQFIPNLSVLEFGGIGLAAANLAVGDGRLQVFTSCILINSVLGFRLIRLRLLSHSPIIQIYSGLGFPYYTFLTV